MSAESKKSKLVFCFPPRGKSETGLYFRVQQMIEVLEKIASIKILYTITPTGNSSDRRHILVRNLLFITQLPVYLVILFKSNLVWVYPSPILLFWFMIAKIFKKKIIIDHFTTAEHAADVLKIPAYLKKVFNYIDSLVYPRIDLILTHSYIMEHVLHHTYPSIKNKTSVLLSVVDTNQFKPLDQGNDRLKNLRQSLGIPENKFIAMYHGLFHNFHGVDIILQAAELAKNKYPDMLFIFIGRKEKEYLNTDNLIFLPSLPFQNLPEYLVLANVWLGRFSDLSVRDRAFSSCMVQAMACGLPIITAQSDASEIIAQSGAGKLIHPSDPEALLNQILWYKNNPSSLKSAQQKARELAVNEFSIKMYSQKLPEIIHNIL